MPELRQVRRFGLIFGLGAVLALSGPGSAESSGADVQIAKAQAALSRGDGVGAEIAFKDALSAGASRDSLAAGMGEALLDQGQLQAAREWLGPAKFSKDTEVRGLRMLARLEIAEGNFAAAASALDRALKAGGNNAEVWADIAQLRYRSGEQIKAIDAIEQALAADPKNVRALDFRGLIVRDQFGPTAALAWFEAALMHAPDDGALLGDYAATLGEAGQARKMLTVTRHMIASGAGEPRALWLQAVLAARAGNNSLARSMLNKLGNRMGDMPAALQLDGVLQLQAGNAELAMQSLEKLAAMQPQNERAQLLLARTMALAGQDEQLVQRFSSMAQRAGASAYLQTLVGRALENLGRREEAAPLLDRAAAVMKAGLVPVAGDGASRSTPPAESAAAQILAGDSAYTAGQFGEAVDHYSRAAKVRFDDALLARLVLAAAQSGRRDLAASTVTAYLAANPQSREAARLAADYAASAGDWQRARSLLEHLRKTGGGRDVRLLSDLAYAELRSGDSAKAEQTAAAAWRMQRSSPVASQVWVLSLDARKARSDLSGSLIARTKQP